MLALLALTSCRDPAPPPPKTPPPPPPTPEDTAGVGATTPPPTFDAPFLWAPLRLDAVVDLGHLPEPVPSPVEAGPILLTEVGDAAGLGESVAGGDEYGVGLAFADVDADGWPDLFVANGMDPPEAWASALWRNRGDGTFEDVSEAAGIAAILGDRDAMSAAAADFDADGDVDLYVGAHPTNVLLVNRGDGTFDDGTAAAGAAGPETALDTWASKIVGFGDMNADGIPDLVSATDTFVVPGPNVTVLRGLGGGRFEDVTAASGAFAPAVGTPCAVMWTDHDADGLGDLAIWSDFGYADANRVLLRSDGARFTDVAAAVGWTNPMQAPMGIDAADVDGDGWLDYFVGDGGQGMLLLSNGAGLWVDATAAAGIATPNAWGLGFEDLDADGAWDLFVAQSGTYAHLLFHNRDLGTDPPAFDTIPIPHDEIGIGNVAVGFADWDRDGDVDLAAAPADGSRIRLWRNDTDRGTHRTLEVEVAAAPGDGARGGVTARVVVMAGGRVLWRDITGGSSRAAQNALSARFGLGQHTGADWVGVLWPDGRQVVAGAVPGDARLVVDGGSFEVLPLTDRR